MSKLDELIKKLCPNGVEFKSLESICPVMRGKRLTKDQLSETGQYIVYHGSKDTPLGYYDNYNVEGDTVIVVNTGGIGGVKYNKDKFWCSDGSFWIKHNEKINNKFLYYYLVQFESYFLSQKRVGGVPTIDKSVVSNTRIPVPPLEVQDEIVRILNDFTLLSAELSAELKARRKQFEYYREKLINENFEKMVPLKDLCEIKGRIGFRGYTRNDLVNEGEGAISFSPGNISNETINYDKCTYVSWEKYNESPEIMINNNDILLCKTGSTLGKVAMVKDLPEKATINPQLVVLKQLKCNPQYLKYVIGGYYFQNEMQSKKGLGSVPNISQKDIGNIIIKLHDIESQIRIGTILSNLDSMCNDISKGLPAEIEARKKQYEYYRDKLLTFKELVNEG